MEIEQLYILIVFYLLLTIIEVTLEWKDKDNDFLKIFTIVAIDILYIITCTLVLSLILATLSNEYIIIF